MPLPCCDITVSIPITKNGLNYQLENIDNLIPKTIKVRLLRIELPTGDFEILATNLFEIGYNEFKKNL